MKKIFLLLFIAFILVTILYAITSFTQILKRSGQSLPKISVIEEKIPVENIPLVSIVAENLTIPWALAFLPNNAILISERGGEIKLFDERGITEIVEIGVHNEGESGLHGIAADPDFEENNYIYIYYTVSVNGDNSTNRVARYTFSNNLLTDETVILDNIPGARVHDGGRIKFGPDGYLYITTGDAAVPSSSQDTSSLAGKILRVDKNGRPAKKNPFGNLVYSYGHRNPQGIAWDDKNQLFATEHGNSATDEFNKIESGNNYGWPVITGSKTRTGMQSPIVQSGNTTWAPAGLTYANGKFYFGGLRGNALYQIEIINGEYMLTEYFKGEFGRIREVVKGPDNMLYITTTNRDGRGIPSENDDKIIRINPFIL